MQQPQMTQAVQTVNPFSRWTLAVLHDDHAPIHPHSMAEVLLAGGKEIPARVPGNFELDLIQAGLLEADPYHGDGVTELQKYEDCHVYYCTRFVWERQETTAELVLEGVDTLAEVCLNGAAIGACENMMIAHRLLVQNLCRGENELFIHIRPVGLEARRISTAMGTSAQPYNYESALVRKAPHSFGWDIAPRVVSAGLWRPIYFEISSVPRIVETCLVTDKIDWDRDMAVVQLRFAADIGRENCRDYTIAVEGVCGESTFSVRQEGLWFPAGRAEAVISHPRLWWPRGRGEQNLYDVKITLYRKDTPVDSQTLRFGIRTVRLENTEVLDEKGQGTFRFVVNDEPVYWMGTNWVPADIFHSKDRERISGILKLVAETGCNAIRCWGGNVYEDDLFYDLCDEYGFMVWQDFAMACASYPRDRRMQQLIETETIAVVRRLRHHACICLWAGDNECDMMEMSTRNPDDNILTRQVIPQVLDCHDGTRPYLPSSPYISGEAWKTGNRSNTTEQHTWGPRDYFKGEYYRSTNPCFASEVGYHGCPSPDSVRRFIDPEFCWPPEENAQWNLHCVSPDPCKGPHIYRIPLMTSQVEYLFGRRREDLETFAAMSQISQAEADKYFIEKYRIAKGHTGGLIWWNMMDCWPQFSDAVVDYYFVKKLAFSYIQASQQQLCLMMDDRDGDLALYGVNDNREARTVSYKITDAETGTALVHGQVRLEGDSSTLLKRLPKPKENRFYRIAWTSEEEGECEGRTGVNHYLSFTPPISYDWYRTCMKAMEGYQFHGFSPED